MPSESSSKVNHLLSTKNSKKILDEEAKAKIEETKAKTTLSKATDAAKKIAEKEK